MISNDEKEISVTETFDDTQGKDYFDNLANSIEAVRKCPRQDIINTSWEHSNYVSFHERSDINENKTPPFVSIMVTDVSSPEKTNSSTQTETSIANCGIVDVSLSFTKDFNFQDSTSNSEQCLGNKRFRRDSIDDVRQLRPWKKTKCTDSCTSSNSDLAAESEPKLCVRPSNTLTQLSSTSSETSFKSIHSHNSIKVRKRRVKTDSNLFRDVLQRSRKSIHFAKPTLSENNTSGGTPRRDRGYRRANRTKSWKLLDLCTWIGRKGYQSITGLYSDAHREPIARQDENPFIDELKEMKICLGEVLKKQKRMERENETLHSDMKEMTTRIEELEGKLSRLQESAPTSRNGPPPPPPLPPPPPPPPPPAPAPMQKLTRSHTMPRCGSAPPRILGPRLAITPQDIANVKLRKAKDNPRTKPLAKESTQPLVTEQMLQSTRAKLGRTRPVASSTPKQQLSELEKCLLQESSVTSLYRRRVVRNTFRSAEELRARPYPATRHQRSPHSPRSPRSNSLPRSTPLTPTKFPVI